MLFPDIFLRVKLTSILIIIACLVSAISKKVKVKHGPSGMSFDDNTNCSEFSKFGRFNPLSVLRDKWFVFYYWAPVRSYTTYIFTFPSANHTKHLKRLLNGNVVLPVMWSARQILMEDNQHYISLLVERSDRGEYWLYPVAKGCAAMSPPTYMHGRSGCKQLQPASFTNDIVNASMFVVEGAHKITPRDIRLKQTGDNRLVGFMDCIDQTLLVMARLNDVPRKNKLLEEAMRLGYRGRKGRSYLYQGHEWGPIPEADEELFWDYRKKDSKDTSTEDKSSEGSTEEVESHLTNKQEPDSEEKKSKTRESKAVSPAIADLDHEMCVKVEPELWNDPKPNPTPDNSLITKEELDNLDDTNNTLTIETSDGPPNNKQENKLDEESEKTQENDKLDNQNDLQPEMKVPVNGPKNLELHTENTDPEEDENCVVCYKSQVSYVYTGEPYIPVSSSDTNLKKNEKVPHPEVPQPELPHPEEPLAKVPRAEIPLAEVSRAEMSRAKVPPRPTTPQQDLTNSSEVIILSPRTLDDLKS